MTLRPPCLPMLAAMLALPWALSATAADATAGVSVIRVSQLGYLPGARKLAVVEGTRARAFEVVGEADGRVVLRGGLSAPMHWTPAGRDASVADLSALDTPGHYRIRVAGAPPSDPFQVSADAHAGLADAALKAYYFQRSGTPLPAQHAGIHARAGGHRDTGVLVHPSAATPTRPAGTVVAAPGGWYDAGDYNKYVVSSGITMWTMLAAYEHHPEFFVARSVDIPESGNTVPDILDEAWWNLAWMLDMQDPGDGGVYHKLTDLAFGDAVMPAQAAGPRFMVGKSTAAALDFAASMAMASRIYGPFESHFPGQPARMRQAAEAAWQWALANPDVVYRQPADVSTGAYDDAHLADEFAWAAAELFVLTGEATYLRAFEDHATTPGIPSWSDVGPLAWVTLAHHRERLPDPVMRASVAGAVVALADRLAAQWRESAWQVAMQPEDFVWGSNAQALNQGVMLLQGYRLTRRRDHLDAAQSQLDYVLGRNPLGVSFVTGQGLRPPMQVFHRPSIADGIQAPVPGLLVGGPHPGQQDAAHCPVPYASGMPALSWLDHECSFAGNAVAINWNAPLLYVATGIQVLTPDQ